MIRPAPPTPRARRWVLWGPVAVYMAAIYYGAAMPDVPGPVSGVSDTFMHFGGYAGLALLTLRATAGGHWSGVTRRALLLAFAIAMAHGATVEIEQMFVPTRFAEWRDLGNNALGAAAGLLAAWGWSTITG